MKELEQLFIDEIKERHPGLDRTAHPYHVVGFEVPDRWLQVVMLRGVQIMVAAAGYDVLLLGGLETPFLALHRDLEPFAVRTITPDVEILVAPTLSEEECQAITKAIEDGVSATRRALEEVAKDVPLAGDVFARRVWAACRAKTRPPSKEYDQRAERYVSLFRCVRWTDRSCATHLQRTLFLRRYIGVILSQTKLVDCGTSTRGYLPALLDASLGRSFMPSSLARFPSS